MHVGLLSVNDLIDIRMTYRLSVIQPDDVKELLLLYRQRVLCVDQPHPVLKDGELGTVNPKQLVKVGFGVVEIPHDRFCVLRLHFTYGDHVGIICSVLIYTSDCWKEREEARKQLAVGSRQSRNRPEQHDFVGLAHVSNYRSETAQSAKRTGMIRLWSPRLPT